MKSMLMPSDYRITDPDTLRAQRLTRAYYKPHANNAAAKMGLRYENRVGRQLQRHVALGHLTRVEHNPWFTFADRFGNGQCSPDFLLWYDEGEAVIIVEVKLTWVEEAPQKLFDLYRPVVTKALDKHVSTLVVCRNTAPGAPRAHFSLLEAITSATRLLQWPDTGPIQW